MACSRVLSWQLTSGAPSSQCAPVGPSSPWWNDCGNDRYRLPGRWENESGAVQAEDRNALGTDGGHTGP
jgi:hypothetical protein